MKFMHLSDLHIGKVVNGFSMLAEQRNIFTQIIGYVQTEKPSAVLIAGDVYDRAVPGIEAVRVFDDFLYALAETGVTVMIIAGNHDSAERLNYASRILSERNIHLCGVFDGKLRSVTLSDEYGNLNFWLMPFIKPSAVRGMFEDSGDFGYTEAVSAVLETVSADYTERNILLSHQFYIGNTAPVLSESEINPVGGNYCRGDGSCFEDNLFLGGIDAVNARVLSRFDYAALGHLHGAQNVSGNARYAGSPLKYSFSECRQKKSVTFVEIKEKGDVTVSTLPLIPIHDMREITVSFDKLTSGISFARGNTEDYMRVVLTDKDVIIDPMGKIRNIYPNVMAFEFENLRISSQAGIANADDADNENSVKLSVYDLFCEFFLETDGAVMSDVQLKIVRELMENISTTEDEV